MANPHKQQGFTIIETMMVLAIAGVLFLMITQAIPTLQRNSRNSQRKQDAAALLASVSRYMLNNSGNLPDRDAGTTRIYDFAKNVKLSHYNPYYVYFLKDGESCSSGDLCISSYRNCISNSGSDGGMVPTSAGAGYRDVVATYSLERGDGGFTPQCDAL